METQREMLKLLRTETGENVKNSTTDGTENETRSFHTPTKTIQSNSTSNHDSDTYVGRNSGRLRPATATCTPSHTTTTILFLGQSPLIEEDTLANRQ